MKKSTLSLLLLGALLLSCAGNPQGPAVISDSRVATGASNGVDTAEPLHWPYPQQERWVEEPVFNGNLHLVEAGNENPQTIMLIHGLGYRGIHDWVKVIPELTDNYHVIAIDLPGFGGSDKQQEQYAPEKYAQLVNWVASQFAHGPVIVIGHSMGGAVSLRFAHNYPEQVSRLIMVDAAGILQRTVFIKHLAKVPVEYEWLAPYQKTIPGLDKLIRKMAGKADGWTQSLLVMMDRMPDIPQLMMSSSLAREFLYKDRSTLNAALGLVYEDFSDAAYGVDVPTHIIWGEHDDVAPIRTGTVLANVMSNAELHVVAESGHVPMTDNFKDFMEALTRSLHDMPHARQAQKRLWVIENETMVKKDLRCDGQNNLVYSGHYKKLSMKNCRGLLLRDLVAESLEMFSSEVTMENVALHSAGTGMTVFDSVVVATLLQVDAKTGMAVKSSYLDIAGANFLTSEDFVDIKQESQLYFSLSRDRQDKNVKALHGVSLGPAFQVR